jgi:hypothetical protein
MPHFAIKAMSISPSEPEGEDIFRDKNDANIHA